MKKQLLFKAFLLLTLLVSACGGQSSTPIRPGTTLIPLATAAAAPTATGAAPTATPAGPSLATLLATPGALPPQVIEAKPAASDEAALDAKVEVTFDQAMDAASVQSAFQVTAPGGSPVSGQFTWPTPSQLRFTPGKPLLPASAYSVTIGDQAASQAGARLGQAYTFLVNTLTPLQVSQVFPADTASDVDVASRITVMFNRPVVALGTLGEEDQAKLPQPLQFSPAVDGAGQWLNTSVYVFQPKAPLHSNTLYTVSLPAGLKDAGGAAATALAQPFAWKFTTRPGKLWQIEVDGQVFDPQSQAGFNFSQLPKITLRFLQPMQPAGANPAITLNDSTGRLLPLRMQWSGDDMSVLLTPLVILPMASAFLITVGADAQTLDGGKLGTEVVWNLNTVSPPGVASTDPANGATGVQGGQLALHFASPMDVKTIAGKVVFKPPLTAKNNLYYDDQGQTAYFSGLAPSTAYQVQILAGMIDRYGNATHSSQTIQFTTAALAPSAGFNMPYNPEYLVGGSQQFFYYYTNADWLDIKLYRVNAKDFVRYNEPSKGIDPNSFKPDSSKLMIEYLFNGNAPLNTTKTDSLALQDMAGKPLEPGFYFLSLNVSNVNHSGRSYVDQRFLAVTKAHLTFKTSTSDALVWATDPASGKPLPDMSIQVLDGDSNVQGAGKTDKDGLLHLDLLPWDPSQGYRSLVAISQDVQTFAYASGNWDSGVYPEQFGINQGFYMPAANTLAYVYSDRPLYRPGQPVYFKGIVRTDNDLAYSLPSLKQVEVVIQSYSQEVFRQTLPLDDYGAFNGQFVLDPEAALGGYTITVDVPGASKDTPALGMLSFTVAEYRKPEFQVQVTASPANLLAGETITANVAASYYSGGGVKGAAVGWTLRSDPFYFLAPAGLSDYSFYDDSLDSGLQGQTLTGDRSRIIALGQAVTGPDGKLTLSIPANVQNAGGSQRLTLEVTVTDVAANAVSAQAQVTAHRSQVYVGIRPEDYVGQEGQPQVFDLAAVDWDGKPLANQKLQVDISQRQWFSVQQLDPQGVLQWVTSVKDTPVASFKDVTSDDKGRASVTFTPMVGGDYRAVVSTVDKAGNPASSAGYLWVAGSEYIPWRQSNDRTFQLVLDKTAYKPGDTASILIASPFQGGAYALVTVERGKIRRQAVLQLSNNSTLYPLPITADMAPVVYVSVVVVKGVDATNPRPAYKIGMAKLNVSTEQQALTVQVTPDKQQVGPGDTVNFAVKTSRADGKPAPAEVSLGLSDLATLSLMDPNSPPILDFFYSERNLSVRTAISIAASMDDFNGLLQAGLASGEHAGGGGGGKGGGEFGVPAVRQNFPDTAFWKADLHTDQNGMGQVSVTLPDNLTTWRMDARAVTLDTRAGQSAIDIVSSRPLLVRPQTPRFMVAGDQVTLGAEVQNNTGQTLSVDVSLDARGVTLAGKPTQTVALKDGEQAFVTWQASVPADSTRADLVFSAKGGSFSDSSRPTLGTLDNQGIPVYSYEAPETVGTAGELSASGVRTEAVRLPAQIPVTNGSLAVKIEPSLAASMTDGLDYLTHYPYECTEQTVSRFLPNVLTTRALQAAGINDPALAAELKTQVSTGLQRLYTRQNADGGWGWWTGNSDDLTSAYVVLGLVEAKAADYTVDQTVLDNGLNYLNMRLPFQAIDQSFTRNRQAFMVYVLAIAGQTPVSIAVALFDKREWLDLYGRALLAETLFIIDPKDPRLDTLRSDLINAAVLSATGTHWQEKTVDFMNWNTDTRSTAIILEALTHIDPQNPLTANAVRWLMASRTDGHWRSTQETAFTLMALTDWMVQSGELNANYAYAVQLNGKTLGQGQVNKDNLRTSQTLQVAVKDLLAGQANRLVFARDGQGGALYYTTHLTVYLPAGQVKALDQGILLTRRYYALNNLKTPITQANLGQELQVALTIVAPKGLSYVLVNDPLPAGLEGIDISLKSSPTNDIPQDYDWTRIGQDGWGWWYFPHAELRDEKVVLSADYLPGGTYTYTYRVRAMTAGVFQVIPPTAQEFYFPEVYGRGDGSAFTVTP